MTGPVNDEYIKDHRYTGELTGGSSCQFFYPAADEAGREEEEYICGQQAMMHANPGSTAGHLIHTSPHAYVARANGPDDDHCAYGIYGRVCGYSRADHTGVKRNLPVRMADVAQYAREPMPDAARGRIAATLIDAPVDPLGTLAVISGIYKGRVHRSKSEVTDQDRRDAWEAMGKTVLSGPLESMQFTFLIEGVDRAMTHQMVRNRFAFFAQESLRFAVAEDWAAEVALPPALLGRREDDPLVAMWRKGLNAAEDTYAALVAAGMPAEEARGLLPHAIPTRLFWTMSVRTLVLEAGKRTCTQAQFPWRILMAEIRKALLVRAEENVGGAQPETWTGYKDARGDAQYTNESVQKLLTYNRPEDVLVDTFAITGDPDVPEGDRWQYELIADVIQPVCYQTGRCGFKAEFDRACSIRDRVDRYERHGIQSSQWSHGVQDPAIPETLRDPILPIKTGEWLADPAAARVVG